MENLRTVDKTFLSLLAAFGHLGGKGVRQSCLFFKIWFEDFMEEKVLCLTRMLIRKIQFYRQRRNLMHVVLNLILESNLFSTKQYAFLPFRLPERLIWYPLAHTTGTIRSHMFIDFAFTKS